MQILIIDDEPATRRRLASFLEQAGHATEEAGDPATARTQLARKQYDVAFCQMDMPGGGLALLHESARAGIGTAFVIECRSLEAAADALRAGASDYVMTPVNADDLRHRLERIAALRQLQAENRALRRAAGDHNGADGAQRTGRDDPLAAPTNGATARCRALGSLVGTLRMQLRHHESEIIVRALEESAGDRRLAAQRLGIGLSSLYRKIDELQIRDRVRASP